jgi:hypothetical protein
MPRYYTLKLIISINDFTADTWFIISFKDTFSAAWVILGLIEVRIWIVKAVPWSSLGLYLCTLSSLMHGRGNSRKIDIISLGIDCRIRDLHNMKCSPLIIYALHWTWAYTRILLHGSLLQNALSDLFIFSPEFIFGCQILVKMSCFVV